MFEDLWASTCQPIGHPIRLVRLPELKDQSQRMPNLRSSQGCPKCAKMKYPLSVCIQFHEMSSIFNHIYSINKKHLGQNLHPPVDGLLWVLQHGQKYVSVLIWVLTLGTINYLSIASAKHQNAACVSAAADSLLTVQ